MASADEKPFRRFGTPRRHIRLAVAPYIRLKPRFSYRAYGRDHAVL